MDDHRRIPLLPSRTFYFIFVLSALFSLAAAGQESALKELVNQAPVISLTEFDRLRGMEMDPLILPNPIVREQVVALTKPLLDAAMEKMIVSGWGSLHLFANPYFCKEEKILYFSRDLLRYTFTHYQISVAVPQSGRLNQAVSYQGKTYPSGTEFEMEFALLGACKTIAAFPMPLQFHRDDPPFNMYTGNYEAYRVNILYIDADAAVSGRYAIKEFVGRNTPAEDLRPLRVPFNLPLQRTELLATGDTLAKVPLMQIKMNLPLFEKKPPKR